jgi:hypothetical protein
MIKSGKLPWSARKSLGVVSIAFGRAIALGRGAEQTLGQLTHFGIGVRKRLLQGGRADDPFAARTLVGRNFENPRNVGLVKFCVRTDQ